MNVLFLGHKDTKGRLRAIAQALRELEGRSVGIDSYFNGDLVALCQNPERFLITHAVVFGLGAYSRDEECAEYSVEQELLTIVRGMGCALFLVPDETGVDAPYLRELGKAVSGVLVYPIGRGYDAADVCPAAYPLHVPDPLVEARPAANIIREITRSPGYILPTW